MINIMYAVDPIKRIVKPMSGHAVTEQDHEASSLRFAFPDNIAGTGLDSTGTAVRVMYIRPDGGDPVAKTLTFYKHSGGYYLYDWSLQKNDLQKEGRLVFSLCILNIAEGEVSEWHTTPCAVRVLSTIHTDDSDEGDETITPTVAQRVAVLESMIQRVASGAPIVVASTSAMTDTDQIYVLSTDGKWYYHNGTTWVSGGTYGGVAAGSITTDKLADGAVTAGKIASGVVPVVDSTLTQTGAAADAKVVGDELSDLKSAINDMTTATAEDEGKALKAKTVSGGKVTEWEFGDAGSRVVIDYTLTQAGEAADAYAAGKALTKKVDYEFAFDVENGTEKYLNNSGIWKSDTRFFYSVSELIPCKEGYKYEYRVATYGAPVATVLFYQNNVFVSALTEYKGTITIPSGVNGVRFQSAKNSEPSLYVRQVYPKTFVEVEETIASIDEKVEETIASIDKTVQNKADYDFVCEIESGSGKYIRPNGNTSTDTRFYYKITNRIPCAPGDVFLYSGIGNTIYSASVLYYLDGSFVSGETYSKKRIITIPDGVNGVIFQSAKMSDDVQLSVQKLYPAIAKSILADKNNEKKVWATSNTGPAWETPRVPSGSPYGEIDFVTLFGDDSLYSLTLDSRWYCSTMPIPPYSIIDRVRFKSAASGNGQIVIASTEYIQSRYMVNVKVYNVTYSAGWNEVPIEFDVGEHDNYLIGHKNLNLLYADQTVLDGDVDSKYMFSNGTFYESNASSGTDAENTKFAFGTISNKKTCMAFDAHIYTGSVLEKLYKLTHHTGLPRLIDILKFKVIDGNIGYVGRWYNYSDNGDTYKIASSDGAYICFKVSGATAVSIEWGGTYLSKSCISYRIDNGDFVRDFVNPNGNTISIADTDEHIVQVVMDAIDVNWWNVGNGIGIKAIHTDGTLKAIKPANKRIIFFGDSLTQGVRALGVETTENPNCNSAINSYGWYMAKYLNANPIIVGYGSSGVTVNGSFSKCINAINYVANGIGTDDEQVDLIVINHGHNDASTSSNEFIAAYTDVLERFMTKYPAVPVMCVTPFNNAHASDVRVCAEAMPNCFFVDTSSWGLAQYYADGPGHLLAAGADYCGQKLAKEALNFGIF